MMIVYENQCEYVLENLKYLPMFGDFQAIHLMKSCHFLLICSNIVTRLHRALTSGDEADLTMAMREARNGHLLGLFEPQDPCNMICIYSNIA